VLNVGKDFPDASRCTVFVTMGSDHADPSTTYKGKTITVTGKIELYHNVPEIRAKAADVKIQK
jgi:DNA/RNA endonuclease YhcR with UshA esterase domain